LGDPIAERWRILDVCCGTGNPAYALLSMGAQVTCSDGSSKMIDRFLKHLQGEGLPVPDTRCARWHDVLATFGSEAFDMMLCMGNSICHLPMKEDGVDEALRNFAGTLRPGGVCLLDVKKYTHQFQELNWTADKANLAVRWYRCDQIHDESPAGRVPVRRYHLLSDYDLDSDHQAQIRLLKEEPPHWVLQEVGVYDFWPVGVEYLEGALRRSGFAEVHVADMRLTGHKYDLVMARK